MKNSQGADVTITSPPMVAILELAPPRFYEHNNLDPEWAGQIKVIGSKLVFHSDFAFSKARHMSTWDLSLSDYHASCQFLQFLTESLATSPPEEKSERPTSVGEDLIADSSVT